MNNNLKNIINPPKPYSIDRENKTITINWKTYKYNAFSILNDWIKIYKGNEYFIKFAI